ncbi:hypothetical protein [Bradyrhizobium sp. DASA03120]|uniref:hypothetical protein n=1 Tax=Bradyrhizobium sp. SMVTL-02 TaxID=3395917 RepID=UPI003F718166
MTTEHQRAANRRNAKSSTGPRSANGKRRASRNAVKHRLSVRCDDPNFARRVEALARQIVAQYEVAGGADSALIMALARTAAEAELERQRVQAIRAEFRNRAFLFGSLEPPQYFRNDMAAVKWAQSMFRCLISKEQRRRPRQPKMINSDEDMPTQPAERMAEGTRRVLDHLLRLDGYAARAIGRRDRALRSITRQIGSARQTLQNEPN